MCTKISQKKHNRRGQDCNAADGDFAANQLGDAGHNLYLAVGLLAYIKDVASLLYGGAGDGDKDLLDLVLFYILKDALPAAYNGDTVDVSSPFVRVVVDDADNLLTDIRKALEIAENNLSGAAGSSPSHWGTPALRAQLGVLSHAG